MAGLPYSGDLQAAMKAQDRTAVRVLMEHRDRLATAAPSAAAAPTAAVPLTPRAAESASEPELAGVSAAAAVLPMADRGDVGTVINVKVKYGKDLFEMAIDLGAGVSTIQQKLAGLTRVPVSAQTLLAPGGRKWTPASDMAALGAKEGMKLTLIGKVPPSWRQLEVVSKAVGPLSARAAGMAAEAGAANEGLALEEQLTKLLLQLDAVAVGDDAELRAARRRLVDVIQALLDSLEAKRG
jgi:hypothetical protein